MASLTRWLEISPIVKKAYDFAEKTHQNQKRISGEPYFNHCVKTAEKIADWRLDEITVAAALLHDVPIRSDVTIETLKEEFGENIAFLVETVKNLKITTKLKYLEEYEQIKKETENMKRFVLAISKDIRVLLIKFADRLHNMRTLDALPQEKKQRIATETLEVYAPLAYRLGMFELAGELEDLSFLHVHPKEYSWLIEQIKDHYENREKYARIIKPLIKNELVKGGIKVISIDSRAKHYASLYRKLIEKNMDMDRIYDLVAIRCIVSTIEDCYSAMGTIHKIWIPVPGRIKDYIALPKPNGYQSLHTTIIGPDEKMLEVQLRTQEMDHKAEHGVASHWIYQLKAGEVGHVAYIEKSERSWIERLRDWQKYLIAPRKKHPEFLSIDFLTGRILTLTPKGKVIDLPKGATPIDFAYEIHSEIGDSCIAAKVNDKPCMLNISLQSGDVVEIITQKNKKASPGWLEFVKTSQARSHIKASLRRKILK